MSLSILKHGYLYKIKDPRACMGIFNYSPLFSGFEIITFQKFQKRVYPYLGYTLINHPLYKIRREWDGNQSAIAVCELGSTPFLNRMTEPFSPDKTKLDIEQKKKYLIEQQKHRCVNCDCSYF